MRFAPLHPILNINHQHLAITNTSSIKMTGGLPSYQQSRTYSGSLFKKAELLPRPGFPNEKPPTLFSPASPKVKATKPAKDVDAASMMSTSTFSSTVGLIKSKIQDHKAHKETKKEKKPLPKDTKSRKYREPIDWDCEQDTSDFFEEE
jgi:hypothetical protein